MFVNTSVIFMEYDVVIYIKRVNENVTYIWHIGPFKQIYSWIFGISSYTKVPNS